MGNKQTAVSFAVQYEQAAAVLGASELSVVRNTFQTISGGTDATSIDTLIGLSSCRHSYVRKFTLPRLFAACDMRKDGVVDMEEYVCAVSLLRNGSIDDKCKFLLCMYDPTKGGSSISKDGLRNLLVEAMIISQDQDNGLQSTEEWIASLRPLSDAMVESAMSQYCGSTGAKMDLHEFLLFYRIESTVQAMVTSLLYLLGDKPASQ